MTRIQRSSILILALALAPAAQARADDVVAAVEAANRALISALLAGDAAAAAAHYTEDAQVIPPGAPPVIGRPAIAAFWQGAIDAGIRDARLETSDAESVADLAYETGTLHLVDNDGAKSLAHYVVVWKRVDGVWLLHRDIWNAPS